MKYVVRQGANILLAFPNTILLSSPTYLLSSLQQYIITNHYYWASSSLWPVVAVLCGICFKRRHPEQFVAGNHPDSLEDAYPPRLVSVRGVA